MYQHLNIHRKINYKYNFLLDNGFSFFSQKYWQKKFNEFKYYKKSFSPYKLKS